MAERVRVEHGILETMTGLGCILATLAGTASCASTSATVVSTDPMRIDITCRRKLGSCYERAAKECPNGFIVVAGADHSGAVVWSNHSTRGAAAYDSTRYGPTTRGTATYDSTTEGVAVAQPIYSGEMIVECKSDQTSETTESGEPLVAPKTSPPANAPVDAAGFSFGESVETSRAACEKNGLAWTEGKGSFRCSGTPRDTGVDARPLLRYCSGELCRIDLVVPPPDAEAGLTATRIEKIVASLRSRYGTPTTHDVIYGADCTGAALPGCLAAGNAHFWYEWKWETGQRITLGLGSRKAPEDGQTLDQKSVTTIRLHYGDGRAPDAASSAQRNNPTTTANAQSPIVAAPSGTLPSWFVDRPKRPPVRKSASPPLPATEVYQRVSPSVFTVVVGDSRKGQPVAAGSAVAVADRYLITNWHVVKDGDTFVIHQGNVSSAVTIYASDPQRDLCWLVARDLKLRPISTLRDFDSIKVGETVYSLGTPWGGGEIPLESSLGAGIVSGKRAASQVQLTAPISHGSSGGALVDARGNLVGITDISLEGGDLNFAIRADAFWND
jgi:hypothetical protein